MPWLIVSTCFLLATAALSQAAATNSTSPSELLANAPECAISCIVDGFMDGGCSLAKAADCVCTNTTLQAHVSQCVQTSCIYEDQVAAAQISRDLCRGYPIEDRRSSTRIPAIVLPAITIAVVLLRCISRIAVAKGMWWDDWIALVTTFFLFASGVIALINHRIGFGLHYWDIDPGKATTILQVRRPLDLLRWLVIANRSKQIFYAAQMIYVLVITGAKAALCAFYARVFSHQRFRLATNIFLTCLAIQTPLFVFLIMFQCIPIQAVWDRSIHGRCLNITAISYAGAAVTIIEDLILIAMPIPELMKLQLGLKKKLAVVFLFGFGSFAIIASIIRLKYMVMFSRSYDPTYDFFEVNLWSGIEVNTAIICGSLPALFPLLKKLPGFFKALKNTLEGTWRKIWNISTPSTGAKQTWGAGTSASEAPKEDSHTSTIVFVESPTETEVSMASSRESRKLGI
ncbi:Putative extracellular membrane protein, CFEM [Colletotrichum destructivum]|uniref:Extracellular membrane protein, CFEM n=1 Tax=Colletotrichum destructivum TaxID=34406 RepID=A0AAX4IAQ9_9PEZI|nr:Putative extracellular membrane protein, CFEM [Colletotrichum destructivum]